MQTAKLVIGILSLVLSMLILFQSCAVGILNSLEESGDLGGSAGLLVVLCWWVAGIVGIAARKSKRASLVACGVYALAGIIGIQHTEVFGDLLVYGLVSFVFAIVFGLSSYLKKKG